MPKGKGHKSTKGVPELHDELKTRVNLSLTPTAVQGLDSLASQLELSRSELVEQIGRGRIRLEKESFLDSINPNTHEFLGKAIQRIRETDKAKAYTSPVTSSVNIIPFRDRNTLPNVPGAYIVTDLIAEYQGTTLDLHSIFLNDEHIKLLTSNFAFNLDEDCFVFWQVCQEYNILPYAMQQLRAFFSDLRSRICLDQLAINLHQQGLLSEYKDYGLQKQTMTIYGLGGVGKSALLSALLEEEFSRLKNVQVEDA